MIKLGYLKTKNKYDINEPNLRSLTHVNISFAKVVDVEGTVSFECADKAKLHAFRKQNPNIIMSIAIGGWGAGNFSEAASSSKTRKNFIKTTLEIIKEYNLDGVDLDWEYPCVSSSGISSSPADKQNFTMLMCELREALSVYEQQVDQKMILTFAAGASDKLVQCVELDKLYEITDFMNLMTYDMGGSFGTTGFHSSLYESKLCSSKGGAYYVDLYHNHGYKKDKIVYGAAFYGRGGDETDGINCAINGNQGLYFDYHDIIKMKEDDNFSYVYDEKSKGAYIYDGNVFVSFDAPQSIVAKLDYVKEENLLGIMFWEYATDETHELIEIIINYV